MENTEKNDPSTAEPSTAAAAETSTAVAADSTAAAAETAAVAAETIAAAAESPAAAAETTATPRRLKRRKSRDAKHRRFSGDGSEGGAKSQEITRTESTTKSRKKRFRKVPEDVAGASPKVPPYTAAPETQEPAPPSPPPPPITVAPPEETPVATAAAAPTCQLPEPPASDKEGVVPPIEEREPKDVLLVSIATCLIMVAGMALVVAGIILGVLAPDTKEECPPLESHLEDGAVMVTTSVGRLIGRTMTVDGARLSRFFGVPFAETTAGERRFALPVAMSRQGPCRVRDCVEPRPPCAHLGPNDSLVGAEDCLHANVWAPEMPPPVSGSRAFVVAVDGVWFEAASSDHPDWPQLAAKGDVVVMAPNHRLGVLGFLHPPDSPDADVAVDDVVIALQWARENAAAFHADPKQLVVVGRGSGAYMLSAALRRMPNDTASRALYHGLVFGSLLPMEPVDPSEPFRNLAEALHCGSTAKSAWLACFRDAPLRQLLVASRASKRLLPFGPRLNLGTVNKPPVRWPRTVLAGSDAIDVRTFFSDRILPLAESKAKTASPEALLQYLFDDVFNIPNNAKFSERLKLRVSSVAEIAYSLPNVMTLCPTLRVAQAAPEGYHYLYESTSHIGPFRPPLGVVQVAQFVSKGCVLCTTRRTAQACVKPVAFFFRKSLYTVQLVLYKVGILINLEKLLNVSDCADICRGREARQFDL